VTINSSKGKRPATASLAAKHPLDMSQYLGQDAALSFSMKVDKAPKGEVQLSMVCDKGCDSALPWADMLASAKLGEYVDYNIDLGCFVSEGSKLDALTEAFVMRSTGALDVVVADIKIVPNVAKDKIYRCS